MKKIIIIQYNCSHLLELQLMQIFTFCTEDKYTIALYDNSNQYTHITANRNIMQESGAKFRNVDPDFNFEYHQLRNHGDEAGDFSRSHSSALNKAYMDNINTDVLLFMDHDVFPYRNFNLKINEGYLGEKICGLKQIKQEHEYLWPGLLLIRNKKIPMYLREVVDFSPNSNLCLDTGGELRHLINQMTSLSIKYYLCTEVAPAELAGYDQWLSMYQKIDGRFMHFGKSSDWYPAADKAERTNKCIQILQQLSV